MRPLTSETDSRLLCWQRVREFAVPPSMIESATARRYAGDWAGACAAARIDVDLDLRTVARTYGRDFTARLRADLRHLAPDLLRWHMPRIAPDGLLRPGLTISLAHYESSDGGGEQSRRSSGRSAGVVRLVVRTPPAWADAGQRISLTLWDGSRPTAGPHPHPRPDRRFRLDLHRHLWDARCAARLRQRSTGDGPDSRSLSERGWRAPSDLVPDEPGSLPAAVPGDDRRPAGIDLVPPDIGCAVDRWGAEAALLLRSDGLAGSRFDGGGGGVNGQADERGDDRAAGRVAVRLDARRRLILDIGERGDLLRIISAGPGVLTMLPVLPDAATWTLPDLELLRAGLIDADQLHPLVAPALVPGYRPLHGPRPSGDAERPRLVDCRGVPHRIGLVQGVLVPLDHDPAEIRREELLAAFGGAPMPCLQVIDAAHRQPEDLVDVRARLDHGDAAGALAAVERLLGPDALLRSGALLAELQTAALRRVTHGLYRAGLAGLGPARPDPHDCRRRATRARRRFTTTR